MFGCVGSRSRTLIEKERFRLYLLTPMWRKLVELGVMADLMCLKPLPFPATWWRWWPLFHSLLLLKGCFSVCHAGTHYNISILNTTRLMEVIAYTKWIICIVSFRAWADNNNMLCPWETNPDIKHFVSSLDSFQWNLVHLLFPENPFKSFIRLMHLFSEKRKLPETKGLACCCCCTSIWQLLCFWK